MSLQESYLGDITDEFLEDHLEQKTDEDDDGSREYSGMLSDG